MQKSLKQQQIGVISAQYLQIQESTEYLKNVFRYSRKRARLNKLEKGSNFSFDSLCRLMVQLVYLLFSSTFLKFNLYISQDIFCKVQSRVSSLVINSLFMNYLLQKQFEILDQNQQVYITKNYDLYIPTKSPQIFGEFSLKYLQKFIQIAEQHFHNQTQSRQIKELKYILLNFIKPNIKTIHNPKIVILCLQQCELFRQNSNLLKIINNSIYTSIRFSKKFPSLLLNLLELQEKLIRKIQSKEYSKIQKMALIEEGISQMIKCLVKNQIVVCPISVNQSEQDQQYTSDVSQQRKAVQKICHFQRGSRPFNEKVFKQILNLFNINKQKSKQIVKQSSKPKKEKKTSIIKIQQETRKRKSAFQIQYNREANIISIQCISNIEITIENVDLLFLSCIIIQNQWSNVSIEISHNTSQNQRHYGKNIKFLSFRTCAKLNENDRPFTKILLMIDLVMICAKISQKCIRKGYHCNQEYENIKDLQQQVQHSTKIHLKKVEKAYKILSQKLKTSKLQQL